MQLISKQYYYSAIRKKNSTCITGAVESNGQNYFLSGSA